MAKKFLRYANAAGEVIPGVTTALKVFWKGPRLDGWLMKHGNDARKMLKEAGEFGDKIHGMCEAFLRGQAVKSNSEQ